MSVKHGTRHRSNRSAAAAVIAVLALLAAGCGSKGSGGGTGSAAGSGTIGISVIVPTGTSLSNFPQVVAGAKAAVRAVNAAGGINGKMLVIDYCNEGNDINKAAECTRNAVASSDIATVGLYSNYATQAVLPALGDLPDLAPEAISPAEVSCATCYPIDATPVATLGAEGPLGTMSGISSAAMVSYDIPASQTAVAQLTPGFTASHIAVKDDIAVPTTTSDWAPIAQRFKDSGAQAFIPVLPEQQTIAFLQAAQQAGITPRILATDGQIQVGDLATLGSYADGALVVAAFPPASAAAKIPGVEQWLSELKAEQNAGDAAAAASSADGNSMRAWLAVHIIAEVAKTIHGTVDRASFTAALKSAHDIDLLGILPNWTPGAPGAVSSLAHLNNPYVYFTKVENGAYVLAYPKPWNAFKGGFASVS
jgi:ABC-type branched-subunit amino acid transport system substrate-binding protein